MKKSNSKRFKILFLTTSRADFSLIKNLYKYFREDYLFDSRLCVAGSHLIDNFGKTLKEIQKEGISIEYKIRTNIDSLNNAKRNSELLKLTKNFTNILNNFNPYMLIVLGDRFEMLPLVYFAKLNGILVTHLHGGDKTTGSFDDTVRHSITKLSDFHFVINEEAKKRVIQLGENRKFIFKVGGFGVDNIFLNDFKNKKSIEDQLRISIDKSFFLITVHPDTVKSKTSNLINNILISLKSFSDFLLIFTSPNFDKGHQIIDNSIKRFCQNNSNAFYFKSLGGNLYLSIMKLSSLVIGNSSSGILEAPYLKKITVNIGDRQKGRSMGKSIVNCKDNYRSITKAIKKSLKNDFPSNNYKMFGDKGASLKTYKKLSKIILTKSHNPKEFNDLKI